MTSLIEALMLLSLANETRQAAVAMEVIEHVARCYVYSECAVSLDTWGAIAAWWHPEAV